MEFRYQNGRAQRLGAGERRTQREDCALQRLPSWPADDYSVAARAVIRAHWRWRAVCIRLFGRSPRCAYTTLDFHRAVLGELLHVVEYCRLGHCENLFGVLLSVLHHDPV